MRSRVRRLLRGGRRLVRSRVGPRAAVLMYHGIGDAAIDPWGLFVSPSNFEQHLEVLAATGAVMGLEDLTDRAASGTLAPGTTAVTFDDGYANNLYLAKPLLDTYTVPATVFVIGEPSAGPAEFWWDRLAGAILRPGELPATLDLCLPGGGQPIELGPATGYSESQWRQDHHYRDEEMPAGPRMQLYRDIWQRLLKLAPGPRRDALEHIVEWAAAPISPRSGHRSLMVDELIELDGGPVSVGGHTMTHPLLPEVPPDRVRDEIGENKLHLESVLDRSVTTFSYPFGAHDDRSVAEAASAGYRLAVTTRPETVSHRSDRHRLGRFDVKNWNGEEFERRLRRWLRYR